MLFRTQDSILLHACMLLPIVHTHTHMRKASVPACVRQETDPFVPYLQVATLLSGAESTTSRHTNAAVEIAASGDILCSWTRKERQPKESEGKHKDPVLAPEHTSHVHPSGQRKRVVLCGCVTGIHGCARYLERQTGVRLARLSSQKLLQIESRIDCFYHLPTHLCNSILRSTVYCQTPQPSGRDHEHCSIELAFSYMKHPSNKNLVFVSGEPGQLDHPRTKRREDKQQ